MKILIVHNEYGKYSGEEAVVDKMVGIFYGLGHEVAQLRMSTMRRTRVAHRQDARFHIGHLVPLWCTRRARGSPP